MRIRNFEFPAVGREGFEPPKASGRQIYGLLRLTASLPAQVLLQATEPVRGSRKFQNGLSWRRDLNPQPADYKSAALPLSYTSMMPKLLIYKKKPKSQQITRQKSPHTPSAQNRRNNTPPPR